MPDKLIRVAVVLPLCGALLLGCRSQTPDAGDPNRPVAAVATVGMVADLVRQVGGDHVEVTQICGSGVDPHLYMPTRDDVRSIMDADVVFYCGLMLEGKMVGRNQPVVAVTDALERSNLIDGSADLIDGSAGGRPDADNAPLGHPDPHVWNDVSLWLGCIDAVRGQLSEMRPGLVETFSANAERYAARLRRLHRYGREITASIPARRRLLVTSHDAFSYFGRAYGLEVRGIQGVTTDSEAGLQQINALVDLLIQRDVEAVFIESSVSPKNVAALIEGAASRGHRVVTGGTLFSDAMGPAGEYTGTYVGMLDHNLSTVTGALGGEVPAGGFRGWERSNEPAEPAGAAAPVTAAPVTAGESGERAEEPPGGIDGQRQAESNGPR